MKSRRNFIKQLTAAGLISSLPNTLFSKPNTLFQHLNKPIDKIWACLIHLSFNMWEDHDRYKNDENPNLRARVFDPFLKFNEPLWNDVLKEMKHQGMNMVVIDLGDAIQYQSHPEIGVKNAWSTTKLREELAKIRAMGMEPIPKLNFSTGHDAWLGEYSKMVSSKRYYEVCSNLIAEVISLFNNPRFFHLGYDEENSKNQSLYDYIVIRQNDLWWKDFYFFVNEVEKGGSRAWIWSDYAWHNPEMFYKKMPKEVLQSNWYYKDDFQDISNVRVKGYLELEKNGYDQIPTGGYYRGTNNILYSEKSMLNTVKFCSEHISDKHLYGFLQTNWRPTIEPSRADILRSIELTGEAKRFASKK